MVLGCLIELRLIVQGVRNKLFGRFIWFSAVTVRPPDNKIRILSRSSAGKIRFCLQNLLRGPRGQRSKFRFRFGFDAARLWGIRHRLNWSPLARYLRLGRFELSKCLKIRRKLSQIWDTKKLISFFLRFEKFPYANIGLKYLNFWLWNS